MFFRKLKLTGKTFLNRQVLVFLKNKIVGSCPKFVEVRLLRFVVCYRIHFALLCRLILSGTTLAFCSRAFIYNFVCNFLIFFKKPPNKTSALAYLQMSFQCSFLNHLLNLLVQLQMLCGILFPNQFLNNDKYHLKKRR